MNNLKYKMIFRVIRNFNNITILLYCFRIVSKLQDKSPESAFNETIAKLEVSSNEVSRSFVSNLHYQHLIWLKNFE
ncbi:unnamed protein product, partial [Ceratitis capitata]